MQEDNTKVLTPKQVNPPNPTGRGGFKEHPENRNDGRWSSEYSIPFQYNKLIRMKIKKFKNWLSEHPEEERTVAEELAYEAVIKAKKEFKYLVEITDRTSGKSPQTHELTGGDGNPLEIVVKEFES